MAIYAPIFVNGGHHEKTGRGVLLLLSFLFAGMTGLLVALQDLKAQHTGACTQDPMRTHAVANRNLNDRSAPCLQHAAEPMAEPAPEKGAHSPVRLKLDSHIVLALQKMRGEPPFDKPTALDPDLTIDPDGRVLVDITAKVTPGLLTRIETLGGKVINSFERAHAIRALLALKSIEALASHEDVKFVAPAAQATTNREGAAQGSSTKP